MQKETLRRHFEKLLGNPSEDGLRRFERLLRLEIQGIPICPKCNSNRIVKMGFNKRKAGPEQQYRCEKCKHVYTLFSIQAKERRKRYPPCTKCGSRSKKSGFWKWTNSKGRAKKKQRFECLNPECSAFFSQEIKGKTDI